MKKTHPLLTIALLGGLAMSAHADFLWQGGDANWNDSNWYNTVGPVSNTGPGTGTDSHNFGTYWNSSIAGIVTVNSAVATNNLQADRGTRTLDIVSGGSVTVNGQFRVDNRANEASPLITNMGGTSMAVTSAFIMGSANAGDTTTFNVNAGTVTARSGSLNQFATAGTTILNVQGGSFSTMDTTAGGAQAFFVGANGRINVSSGSFGTGSNLELSGGQLNVTGDAAGSIQVGAFSYNGLSVTNSASQLNYVFDSTGVSALNMGRLSFNAATTLSLSVNADALAGATIGQQILLLDYNDWRLGGADQGTASILPQIVFSDNGSTVTGTLINDTTAEALYFEVAAIPEPSSIALLGLAAMALLVFRRRKN